MRLEDFRYLLPYGLLAGAHVTPIDHMYFSPTNMTGPRDEYEVRAIADGVVYNLQPRDINVDTGQAKQREWRMDIAHTCTFTSYFDLLTSITPELENAFNASREGGRRDAVSFPLHAGDLVGRIGGQTLDFGVYDYNVTLPGFLVPTHYDAEPWKVHTVDPFPPFDLTVRTQLLSKLLRQAAPRAGQIDYDVDGRLVGNWFREGTHGYRGLDQRQYWVGHLAIVYDFLDPTQVRFSTGNWSGQARAFGVRGNAPDPRNVTSETGLVEYELVTFEHYARNHPERVGLGQNGIQPGDDVAARNHDTVQGTVLLQLVADRTLKMETFPGKRADEVNGFTAAAILYER